MKGLYLHIPFCRQACRYCDFFFSVSLKYMDPFVDALVRELEQRSVEAGDKKLNTLYLGGGTPSLLTPQNLEKLLEVIHRNYSFRSDPEITIECNPDDLSPDYLALLKGFGFNRLSIGIQSFISRDLELMRRSHSSEQAAQCVFDAVEAGFENITIDLIYGIPGQTAEEWENNLKRAISLPVDHISAYHLTFEPGTVFDHWRKKKRLVPVHEEESVKLYGILREQLGDAGFDHYEISNFARDDKRSEHNQIYWSGVPYMGCGPSAHSYDGTRRSWNISSLPKYLEGMDKSLSVQETEELSPEEAYHDYLITSLRTSQGADPEYISQKFGIRISDHFDRESSRLLEGETMLKKEDRLIIPPEKWIIADHILKGLFIS